MKDGKVSTKELDNYVPEENISQEFKDNVSDALININPNSSDYGIFLNEDGTSFNITDGYATNADIVALHILTGLSINKI